MRPSSGRSLSKNRSRGFTYTVKYYIRNFSLLWDPMQLYRITRIHRFRTWVLWSLMGMVNSMSCSICLWRLCGGKVPWRLVFWTLVGVLLGSRFGFFFFCFLLRQVLSVCVSPAAVAVVLCVTTPNVSILSCNFKTDETHIAAKYMFWRWSNILILIFTSKFVTL
jgi:hypothetical protein